MNKKDIQQFINAFQDFMKHAEVEQLHYEAKRAYLEYENRNKKTTVQDEMNELERKAAELEVTVDYYIAEFM